MRAHQTPEKFRCCNVFATCSQFQSYEAVYFLTCAVSQFQSPVKILPLTMPLRRHAGQKAWRESQLAVPLIWVLKVLGSEGLCWERRHIRSPAADSIHSSGRHQDHLLKVHNMHNRLGVEEPIDAVSCKQEKERHMQNSYFFLF